MTTPTITPSRPAVPKLALSILEACEALGVSHDLWHEHIAPDIRIVRVGRRQLVAVTELQRWLDANGHSVPTNRNEDA